MSRKELKRLKLSREELLIQKGYNKRVAEEKRYQKREEERRAKLKKKVIAEIQSLRKAWLRGEPGKQINLLKRKGVSLAEFIKMATEAGVMRRQAYAVWFSPEGAGAGIF